MSNPQKKSVWGLIATLAIVIPLLYVASCGPACWINQRTGRGGRLLVAVYFPIVMAYWQTALWEPIGAYASLGTDDKLEAFSNFGPVWLRSQPAYSEWPGYWDSVEDFDDPPPDEPESPPLAD